MKILVASAFPADSAYANAVNTIKMADGFAKNGHDVTVVCRQPKNGQLTDADLRQRFHLSSRLCFQQVLSTRCAVPLDAHRAFGYQVLKIARTLKPDFSYCRNYIAPVMLAERYGVPTVAESHAHLGHQSPPLLDMIQGLNQVSTFKGLITIHPVLKDHFCSLGAPERKVHILADAVDVELFSRPAGYSKPYRERPLVVYAGHLYDYKGIPTILDAATHSPDIDYRLVGGHPAEIACVKQRIAQKSLTNVELIGLIPHSQVPPHLWDADVLLLPPSANHPSAHWTSPVKLGEYLAAATPVVATRIPALEYWLTHNEVHFVKPDDAQALIDGIQYIVHNHAEAEDMTHNGYALSLRISYRQRCQNILQQIQEH